MVDASGSSTWDYDSRGRVTQETKTNSGSSTFFTQWGYNSADLVSSMTYPGGNGGQAGEVVNYTYYKQMAVDTVIGTSNYAYVYDTQYEAEGRVDYRTLDPADGTQIKQDFVYNAWTTDGGRLSQILSRLTTDTDSLQDLRYTYNDAGNVLTIKDYKDMTGSDPQTQTFTYDGLNRLASARAQYGSYGTYSLENYTYDDNGNLWTKAGVTYTYQDGAHEHGVTHLTEWSAEVLVRCEWQSDDAHCEREHVHFEL
jgi:YD repeat-containing protein